MAIEMYGSDDAGHLMLLPEPAPSPAPTTAVAPPEGEPPLPGADGSVPVVAAPPVEPPSDELAALRRLIDERDQKRAADDARRDAQVETVTRVLAGQAPDAPAAPPGLPPRPDESQFETTFQYFEAIADWKAQERIQAYQEEQTKQGQAKEQATAQQDWMRARDTAVKAAEVAFEAQHPDYQARVRGALEGKLAPHVSSALMLFDEAPQIAYGMAQDPALVQRLNTMPPAQLLYALGRLSAAGTGAAPPTASPEAVPVLPQPPQRLPTPPRPLSGTGVAPVGGYRDDMSVSEYRAWRQAQTH